MAETQDVRMKSKFNFPQDIMCVIITPLIFRFSARVYIEPGFTRGYSSR